MNSLGRHRSKLALLLSVNAENEEYMKEIRRKTRGKRFTGCRINQDRLLLPATVFFYVTTQGRICYKATLKKIRPVPSEKRTELELTNIDDLRPAKDYTDFRKHDGTKIMGRNALQGIIYVRDSKN